MSQRYFRLLPMPLLRTTTRAVVRKGRLLKIVPTADPGPHLAILIAIHVIAWPPLRRFHFVSLGFTLFHFVSLFYSLHIIWFLAAGCTQCKSLPPPVGFSCCGWRGAGGASVAGACHSLIGHLTMLGSLPWTVGSPRCARAAAKPAKDPP